MIPDPLTLRALSLLLGSLRLAQDYAPLGLLTLGVLTLTLTLTLTRLSR